jgi:hypothetical protein
VRTHQLEGDGSPRQSSSYSHHTLRPIRWTGHSEAR